MGSDRSRARAVRIAWAITIGEAALIAGAACLFADYWLMLPVRFRVMGILALSIVTLFSVFRLILFYRRLNRDRKTESNGS